MHYFGDAVSYFYLCSSYWLLFLLLLFLFEGRGGVDQNCTRSPEIFRWGGSSGGLQSILLLKARPDGWAQSWKVSEDGGSTNSWPLGAAPVVSHHYGVDLWSGDKLAAGIQEGLKPQAEDSKTTKSISITWCYSLPRHSHVPSQPNLRAQGCPIPQTAPPRRQTATLQVSSQAGQELGYKLNNSEKLTQSPVGCALAKQIINPLNITAGRFPGPMPL